jgi:transketolase
MRDVADLVAQLRVDSIRCSTATGSGDRMSSMSAADVTAVLLARHFPYNRPTQLGDHHVLSDFGSIDVVES